MQWSWLEGGLPCYLEPEYTQEDIRFNIKHTPGFVYPELYAALEIPTERVKDNYDDLKEQRRLAKKFYNKRSKQ